MSQNCPHCGEELGRMTDAFCGSCRGEIEPTVAPIVAMESSAPPNSTYAFTVEVTSVATEIRPSRSSFHVEMLKLVVLLFIWIGSTVFYYFADSRVLACLLPLIMLILSLVILNAVRSFLVRNDPLVVDSSGRLFYRDAELTRPNKTDHLQLEERGDSESSPTYYLRLIHDDGSTTSLPNPYFTEIDEALDAVWLAIKLEKLLGVKLKIVK
jgi:hypothetical protein